MILIEVIYMLFALLAISYVLYIATNKPIIGLFAFWMFTYPIFANPKYEITISVINFVLLPNRIVLFPLLLYVFHALVRNIRRSNLSGSVDEIKSHSLFYEKWMVLFLIAVITSEIINIGTIGFRTMLQTITDPLVFLLFYFSIKWSITRDDFHLLARLFLFFAFISALVGIVQFLIDPSFLRFGVYRIAFGQYIRSNGLFSAEYDQGFFQISCLFIGFIYFQKRLWHFLIVVMTGSAVFFTMHRLSWVTWGVALMIIGYYQLNTGKYNPVRLAIAILTIMVVIVFATTRIPDNTFLYALNGLGARVNADTLTVRTDYYGFALFVIQTHPFGIGSYLTPYYNQLAFSQGMPFDYEDYNNPIAYVVHNGFLSSGVQYGVIGLTAFWMFTLGNFLFYLTKYFRDSNRFLLPFGMSFIFVMYNLTQDFSNFGFHIMVIYGVLLACVSAYSINYLNKRIGYHDF